MRHMNRVKTLNRKKGHRRALYKNLANALFQHESITTTYTKAMELKKVADKLVTLAKRKDTHAMRLVFAVLRDKEMVRKLFTDICERYAAINGGYTRVLKVGRRKGDAAPMAVIELTQKKEKEDKEKTDKKEKTAKKETAEKKAKPKAEKKEKSVKKEKTVKEKKEKAETKEKKPRKKTVKKEAVAEPAAE